MSPPPVTLRPMTEAEFSTWRPHSLATYAAEPRRAGRFVEDMLPEVTRQMEGFLERGRSRHGRARPVARRRSRTSRWGGCGFDQRSDKAGAAWVYEIELGENTLGGEASDAPPVLAAEALDRVLWRCVSSASTCSATTSGRSTCTDRSATRRRR